MHSRILHWIVPSALCATALGLLLVATARTTFPRLQFECEAGRAESAGTIATAHDMEVERARIAAHLARVEVNLRATDVASLARAQRSARARNLDVLQEYRERGLFPHNHVVMGHRTPVFVDEHGTQCAVGFLIARSGRSDLTQRIARTRNLARIAELAGDPEMQDWLDLAGLTLVEAGMIQPAYGDYAYAKDHFLTPSRYTNATIAATGINGGMIAWNLPAQSSGSGRLPGALGLASGLLQSALGAVGLALDGPDRDMEPEHIAANLVVGTTTMLIGAATLKHAGEETREARNGHELKVTRNAVAWHISEWTTRDVDAGVRVQLRF